MRKQASVQRVAAAYLASQYTGNPDGKGIYPQEIDRGYNQPLAGGTDVMKRLQDELLIEQGREPREPNPRLANLLPLKGLWRRPVFQFLDGLSAMTFELNKDRDAKADAELQRIFKNLEDIRDKLWMHLNNNYRWN